MSTPPVHYQKCRSVSVISPFLRHLNTGTLAFVMFVAFALLSSIRGKESEVRELASAKAKMIEVVIDNLSFSKTLQP